MLDGSEGRSPAGRHDEVPVPRPSGLTTEVVTTEVNEVPFLDRSRLRDEVPPMTTPAERVIRELRGEDRFS